VTVLHQCWLCANNTRGCFSIQGRVRGSHAVSAAGVWFLGAENSQVEGGVSGQYGSGLGTDTREDGGRAGYMSCSLAPAAVGPGFAFVRSLTSPVCLVTRKQELHRGRSRMNLCVLFPRRGAWPAVVVRADWPSFAGRGDGALRHGRHHRVGCR